MNVKENVLWHMLFLALWGRKEEKEEIYKYCLEKLNWQITRANDVIRLTKEKQWDFHEEAISEGICSVEAFLGVKEEKRR